MTISNTKPSGSTVNIHEAADMMNIHAKTVLDLINAGALPAAQIGRAYVLLYRDVMNYIEKEVIRQTAERMGGAPQRRRPAPRSQ